MTELSNKLKSAGGVTSPEENAKPGPSFVFRPATRRQARLRLALNGPGGSGKTYSALAVATALGEKIALIDTERGSASKYAQGKPFWFDVLALESFEPRTYVKAIHAAAEYDVLIIDSLSHAWSGKGGALEQVDMRSAGTRGNNFTAWREVTPMHNELVEAMLTASCHVIATMRTKTEYVVEKNSEGKSVPRKIGLAPIQRDGIEYEFDVVGDLDQSHNFVISKTRCPELDDVVINRPGAGLAAVLQRWLEEGEPPLFGATKEAIGEALRIAKETPIKDEMAKKWRDSHGYKSWTEFSAKATEKEGGQLLSLLSPSTDTPPVAEALASEAERFEQEKDTKREYVHNEPEDRALD